MFQKEAENESRSPSIQAWAKAPQGSRLPERHAARVSPAAFEKEPPSRGVRGAGRSWNRPAWSARVRGQRTRGGDVGMPAGLAWSARLTALRTRL